MEIGTKVIVCATNLLSRDDKDLFGAEGVIIDIDRTNNRWWGEKWPYRVVLGSGEVGLYDLSELEKA